MVFSAFTTGIAFNDEEQLELNWMLSEPEFGLMARLQNHASRAEVRTALAGSNDPRSAPGTDVRISNTTHLETLHVAIPLHYSGSLVGILRFARPLSELGPAIRQERLRLLLGSIAIVVTAAIASFLLARSLSRPLAVLREAAPKFIDSPQSMENIHLGKPPREIFDLWRSLVTMALEIQKHIAIVSRQKDELATIFMMMDEGVIVTDERGSILRFNRKASELLALRVLPEHPLPSIEEVCRQPEFLQFVRQALAASASCEGDISLPGDREVFLQARATPMMLTDGGRSFLFVFGDVTRIRGIEQRQRDFVANVSHELKTPLTSIRGYAEAMVEYGANLTEEQSRNFLSTIVRKSEQLENIIRDLLIVSQLDRSLSSMPATAEIIDVSAVISLALEITEQLAEKKSLQIYWQPPLDKLGPFVKGFSTLFEQAITNVIENAVKYTLEGDSVSCAVREIAGQVVIVIADSGPGIASEHLNHIFERFYRVDKSRSRKLGGTGLGLAICKEIVDLHGGQVAVTSEVGAGSVFTLTFPAWRDEV